LEFGRDRFRIVDLDGDHAIPFSTQRAQRGAEENLFGGFVSSHPPLRTSASSALKGPKHRLSP
jgi:hypothetical protein